MEKPSAGSRRPPAVRRADLILACLLYTSIRQIADALGVSPVYVESEAEYLEEYGFLTRHGDRYLCNILLDETNSALSRLHDEM